MQREQFETEIPKWLQLGLFIKTYLCEQITEIKSPVNQNERLAHPF